MNIGRVLQLPVWVVSDQGVLLGNRRDHVILPAHEAPPGVKTGDRLRVFVYTDSRDEKVATLRIPKGQAGDLVVLDVVDTSPHGVYCDIGLEKDLLVPWQHQHGRLEVGDRAVVYIGHDHEGRLVGHTKLIDFLSVDTDKLQVGDEVKALVYGYNELGALVAVNRTWAGIVYMERLVRRPPIGQELTGYVERIREDGKLDISPVPVGRAGTTHAIDIILDALDREGGFLPLTDHSEPALIRRHLGLTKKAFKKGVGALYKKRRITIEETGIRKL